MCFKYNILIFFIKQDYKNKQKLKIVQFNSIFFCEAHKDHLNSI